MIEARVVELEWPASLRLGDSDIVRLALIPSGEGYTVSTEFPEHQTQTQNLQVSRPGGYDLFAIARLDGVGFNISPSGDQEQFLSVGEPASWRWTLSPRSHGQQRLAVTLSLLWRPQPGTDGVPRQSVAYSKGLNVQVRSFFGLTRGQSMAGGFFGLVVGMGMSLFALVLLVRPSRSVLQTLSPNPDLVVEPHPGLNISPPELSLLRTLFRRYSRLALESEFLSGYSGARTFLALPIRPDGRSDAYTIVKIGDRQAIRQEFANYETFVKDTLPPVTARIQHAPVTVHGSDRAALQYTFIGAPGRTPTSLRQALLQNPDPAFVQKLFETFGPNWWMQRRAYSFRLALEYDRMLPAHLVIEPAGAGTKAAPKILDGRVSPGQVDLSVGDSVQLKNFPSFERRIDRQSLSLRGAASPGLPPLRVRWLSLADPNGAFGQVTATRWTLLQELVAGFDLYALPDPLERLPAALNEHVNGTQSTIHGDLNLENILVGPGDFVWLIDFAQTREGHTLYDFAHLEAEIIAHVVAEQVASLQEYLSVLQASFNTVPNENQGPVSPLSSLLHALHDIASRCLFNSSQPREYHLSLYAACLGALKFANLPPFSRHLLYLTAAHLSTLMP
jgi:hypothetical protein